MKCPAAFSWRSLNVGIEPRIAAAIILCLAELSVSVPTVSAGWVKFGAGGWGSKWDDPTHGLPATVTWGFMPDGTTIDPDFAIASEVVGGSNITKMRTDYETKYGAGSYQLAIERAIDTWEAACSITFVGPIADPNPGSPLPSGDPAATVPDIRIGAFNPAPGSGFSFVGAVGFGPPGDDINFPDAFAGDIMFNLAAGFIQPVGVEDDPIVEFGNDLENLVLHELGHAAIGLGHPDSGPGDVMYVGPGATGFINRQLSADDITGARSVYGPPNYTPGDANLDGLVDGGDYTIWADNYLYNYTTWITGDFTGDGFVDGADYTVWADNYDPSPALASAVPEPATLALAVMGALAAVVRWRPIRCAVKLGGNGPDV